VVGVDGSVLVHLKVLHLNSKIYENGDHEVQVGARLINESLPIDDCKTSCSIQLTIKGDPDNIPKLTLGDEMVLFLD